MRPFEWPDCRVNMWLVVTFETRFGVPCSLSSADCWCLTTQVSTSFQFDGGARPAKSGGWPMHFAAPCLLANSCQLLGKSQHH